MNKNKHRSKTASIMLFSFACLALTGCTLHETLNKPQAETIVDVVEQPHKRNIIKRDNPSQTQENWTINTSVAPYNNYDYWYNGYLNLDGIPMDQISSIETYYTGTATENNTEITIQVKSDWDGEEATIIFNFGEYSLNLYDNQTIDGEFNITLTSYPQEFYNALNPQPEQESMGEQIIDSVESGLGMIGTLATQFLTGFTSLFWDAANSQLTAFGTFSLIFLGIAITFAIIKLILNIVRSNTGV